MYYLFGDYTLDTERYELRRADSRIPLRPKVFQLLVYLLAHRERVVGQEELLAHLWPHQIMGDSALKSCVMAARQAVGDRRRPHQIIQTRHGYGYRFMAAVTTEDQTPPAPVNETARRPGERVDRRLSMTVLTAGHTPATGGHAELLVGREGEVAQLHTWLARALRGERQVGFVSGEAGLGKTTLVELFLHELGGEGALWIGQGQCVEHFGVGGAYRPVLEALGRLSRGAQGHAVVTVLRQQAPTWLLQMPALVSAEELEVLQRRVVGATRERMLRELAEALEGLTAQQPLVLVLEDLHWSDPSTLDLIAVLARRRDPARLLVLGTYRPPEVLRQPHPLATVIQELRLHRLCRELPVTMLRQDVIVRYLTRRFPGLPWLDELARLVHQRTEGQPLFMVMLLAFWLSQGVLIEQNGAWAQAAWAETLHDGVPDSLRQLIEGQLGQLSTEEQRLLEAGSIAGVEFSAAAVAAGLGQGLVQVDDACASLARRGQLLQAVGERIWPDGTVAGGYRFAHALYQDVLYGRVSAARRVQLHQRMGARLEGGYGAEAGALAAELAVHFERGQDYPRAVQYRRQAGENAIQRYSHREAVDHLTKGLELLKSLPGTPERTQHELTLQAALGAAFMATKGYGAAEVEAAYARARQLCRQVGDTPQLFPVLSGLFVFYLVRAECQVAHELAEQCFRLAQHLHDPGCLLEAHFTLGVTLFFMGAFAPARAHFEQGIALYDPQQHRSLEIVSANPGVLCWGFVAHALWSLGYPDQAVQANSEALRLARELSHPFSLCFALNFAAWLHAYHREGQLTLKWADVAIPLATEQGFAFCMTHTMPLRGWALAAQGQDEEGIAQIHQGMTGYRATGAELERPYWLALLAEAYGEVGQTEEGLRVVAEALAEVEKNGVRFCEAELYRLQGELLWRQAVPDVAEAETCFHQALAIARRQQAKSWELRAAMSLSRLWQQRGKCDEARQLLSPLYGWFTEGFDTADLREAKVLLDELSAVNDYCAARSA
jgi:predicted ATPase/DNA-binding winged helix-turn-helix (wHTH) protein